MSRMSFLGRLKRIAKSLAWRLLALTFLWVGFVVSCIFYTMALSWQIDETALAVNRVAVMPAQIYRANFMVGETFDRTEFDAQNRAFENSLSSQNTDAAWHFMSVSFGAATVDQMARIDREWHGYLKPALEKARESATPIDAVTMGQFVENIYDLLKLLNENRRCMIDKQKTIQWILMILAVGSLFVIMWLLLRWVIRPTESIGQGLKAVTEGKLDTRVSIEGTREFEAIGMRFNSMALRLQDLVENLEAKVKEKTMAVEEKNRNLAQLYDITSYFGQQHQVDEMCDGFMTRLMQFTRASACAIFLLDAKRSVADLVASVDLPRERFSWLSVHPIPIETIQASLKADLPLRITPEMPADFLAPLRIEGADGYLTAYFFHIRNGNKDIGFYMLYFKTNENLPVQTYRLYESFGAHLGVAINNLRLIERDQQYAVVQERNLMAQGLHDSIAQSLSFLNLQVQLLEDGFKRKDMRLVKETVGQIKAGVQESYEDVRELLLNFRERLHKESFSEGIGTVIERFEMQTKTKVRLVTSGQGVEPTDKEKLQVIFIMQEALANVRKHSQADQVLITIKNDEDFELCVMDNGTGIDPDLVAKRNKRHVGLNIMKERAQRIGAEVSVGRVDPAVFPSGTVVRLVIPSATRREVH